MNTFAASNFHNLVLFSHVLIWKKTNVAEDKESFGGANILLYRWKDSNGVVKWGPPSGLGKKKYNREKINERWSALDIDKLSALDNFFRLNDCPPFSLDPQAHPTKALVDKITLVHSDCQQNIYHYCLDHSADANWKPLQKKKDKTSNEININVDDENSFLLTDVKIQNNLAFEDGYVFL